MITYGSKCSEKISTANFFLHSTVKVQHYDALINRLTESIRKWSSNCLSYAGRLELIRSVAQGICCYWLSVLPMPVTVIRRIESICKAYLWGSRRGLVAWKDVCRPKKVGGLGLRDLTAWNKALIARIIWDVHNKKDSLWIKWVSEQYLKGRSIWEFIPRKTDSKLMRFVADVRDAIVQTLGGVVSAQTDTTVMSGKPKFDSKRIYFLIQPVPTRSNIRFDMLWRGFIAPKYSFVGWLILHKKLSTKDRLSFLNIDPWCCHCINRHEDLSHVYWRCSFNRKIWKRIKDWTSWGSNIKSPAYTLKEIKRDRSLGPIERKGRTLCLMTTLHHIWRVRNESIFDAKRYSTDEVVRRIKIDVCRFLHKLDPSNALGWN
ncbi:hypothetical protein ACS0TY_021235 [Phlomoides rotata]